MPLDPSEIDTNTYVEEDCDFIVVLESANKFFIGDMQVDYIYGLFADVKERIPSKKSEQFWEY